MQCQLPPLLGMVLAGLLLRNLGALSNEVNLIYFYGPAFYVKNMLCATTSVAYCRDNFYIVLLLTPVYLQLYGLNSRRCCIFEVIVFQFRASAMTQAVTISKETVALLSTLPLGLSGMGGLYRVFQWSCQHKCAGHASQ